MARVPSRGDDIVPISGPKRMRYLAAAGDLTLDRVRLERLETAVPVDGVAGELYPDHAMRVVARCGSLR